MKSGITRLGLLVAAVVGLMGTMAPPGFATTVKVITFAGTATVPAGLGYPGSGEGGTVDPDKIPCTETGLNCVTVKSDPKGLPVVNLNSSEGNISGFSFNSLLCAKLSASTDPAKKFPGTALCTITASGVIWGYCGLSGGIGVATLTNQGLIITGPLKATESIDIKFFGVGNALYVTGGNATRNIRGVLYAFNGPTGVPGGPSCSAKSATSFSVVGHLDYKDIT